MPPTIRLPPLHRTTTLLQNGTQPTTLRPFSVSTPSFAKPLPPRRVIPDSEITENFLKGSGPGGQKINKTSSAVQLIHLPTGIVVKYQDTRSRSQNRKMARRILGERVEELELGDAARTAIRAREKGRKKASADKKKRRKYKALEAAKTGEGDEGADGDGVERGELDGRLEDPAEHRDTEEIRKDG
ncbi:hypothetical protein CC80DRAFT_488524 [Byssothecium circinans]|uniref:Prokaryotic-type class I peptide chain release factors domain-containing protein n=1 Tax=Byssothecium circinans TaxID=147558 RepID=A0A6A5UJC2_9PLEO|nr:hypothetical protein CC80DRAFT_488524 [Byssothecium circinans]